MEPLLKISIAASLAGLVSLFVLSSLPPYHSQIVEINDDMVGNIVAVSGTAEEVMVTENATFISLVDNSSEIKIVHFSSLDVKENDNLTIKGKVAIYRGELELIAHEVREAGED